MVCALHQITLSVSSTSHNHTSFSQLTTTLPSTFNFNLYYHCDNDNVIADHHCNHITTAMSPPSPWPHHDFTIIITTYNYIINSLSSSHHNNKTATTLSILFIYFICQLLIKYFYRFIYIILQFLPCHTLVITAGTRWCFPWRIIFLGMFCNFQKVFLMETQKFYPAL